MKVIVCYFINETILFNYNSNFLEKFNLRPCEEIVGQADFETVSQNNLKTLKQTVI